jgi:tetratricopeptide (TPR) repeat protein
MIRIMMTAMLLIFAAGPTSAFAEELFDSDSAKEHFNAGLDLYFKKDYTDAIKEFETAAQFDPDNANAYYFMGYSYYKLKDMEKAMMVFEQAYETDAKYSPIRNVPQDGPAGGQE